MAISIFPTNSLGVSWGSYPSTSSEGYNTTPKASVSGSTISFSGDYVNGAHQGLIYNNYVAYVNLSSYKKITLTTSSAGVWASGSLALVVQSSYEAAATKVKSVSFSGAKTVSLDVSDLSGGYYVGIYCMLNSYSNEEHNPSATVTITNLSLEVSAYTVTLNKGTGISAVSPAASNTVTPGNSLTINATVKTGYTWKNWTGTTTLTAKENTITPTGDSSYTANATANTYSVKYDPNGGTGTMSDSTHTYDAEKKLTANSFTREGYIFSGWATSATGTKKYDNQQAVKNLTSTKNETFNLYAVWTPISYKVNYYANGGEGTPPSEKIVKYDEEFTTEGIIFTKDGYILKEWNTNAGGTGTSYQLNTAIRNLTTTNNDSIGLYAQWKRLNAMFVYYNNKWREVQ